MRLRHLHIPGFTAEVSIYRSTRQYVSVGVTNKHTSIVPTLINRMNVPQTDFCCGDEDNYMCCHEVPCQVGPDGSTFCCNGTLCSDASGSAWCADMNSVCCGDNQGICSNITENCCPDPGGTGLQCYGKTPGWCSFAGAVCIAPGECIPNFGPPGGLLHGPVP